MSNVTIEANQIVVIEANKNLEFKVVISLIKYLLL